MRLDDVATVDLVGTDAAVVGTWRKWIKRNCDVILSAYILLDVALFVVNLGKQTSPDTYQTLMRAAIKTTANITM